MAQFQGLEGRDTFDASKNYEKVKILNGGIPQNSDLNEQSSIDEERARNIIKEGFGSGVLNPTDFVLEVETDRDLALQTREGETLVGTLYHGGYRFTLNSIGADQPIVIASVTGTPVYRRMFDTGTRRGRIYLVHAKQDYLDPADVLTVRDVSLSSSIEIDTAVREKRVYDFVIDWGDDEAALPERLDSEDLVSLSSESGGVFEGSSVDFSSSPLSGYDGYAFYLGDVLLSAVEESVDQGNMIQFNGVSDNKLYHGGDTAHRRDTEQAGIIFQDETGFAYDGLKFERKSSLAGPFDYGDIGGTTFDEVSIEEMRVKALDSARGEQLHIPSKNNYFELASELELVPFQTSGLNFESNVGGVTDLKTLLQDAFGDTPATDWEEGQVASKPLLLVVDGDDLSVLSNPTSYRLIYGNPSSIENTNSRFIVSAFYFVLRQLDIGNGQLTLDVEDEDGNSKLYDRRSYWINATDRVMAQNQERVAVLSTYVAKVSITSGTFSDGHSVLIGTDILASVVKSVSEGLFLILNLSIQSGRETPIVGSAINNLSASGVGEVVELRVDANSNPTVSTEGTDALELISGESEFNSTTLAVTNKPKTLSTMLAEIRGALYAMIAGKDNSDFSAVSLRDWKNLFIRGIRVPTVELPLDKWFQGIRFFSPSTALGSISSLVSALFSSAKTKDEGKIKFFDLSRTLRDDNGNVQPMIQMVGYSTTNQNFAPMLRLAHVGANSVAEIGRFGGMIVLEGKNGLIACPIGSDFRSVWNDTVVGVVIDGETGFIKSTNASMSVAIVRTLAVTNDLSLLGTVFVSADTLGLKRLVSHGNGDAYHTHPGSENVPAASIIATARTPIAATDFDPDFVDYQKGTTSFQHHPTAHYVYCNGAAILVSKADVEGEPLKALYDILEAEGFPFGYDSEVGAEAFYLPDLRSEFIRGADDGRGIAGALEGRSTPTGSTNTKDIGDTQDSAFQNVTTGYDSPDHTHVVDDGAAYGSEAHRAGHASNTSATGLIDTAGASTPHQHSVTGGSATETRPRNVFLTHFMKY